MATAREICAWSDRFEPGALARLAVGFRAANGVSLSARAPGFWLSDDPARGGLIVPAGGAVDVEQALAWLGVARNLGAKTRTPILIETRRGVSADDAAALKAAGGALLFPLQFFDWHFRRNQEGADDGASGVDRRLRAAVDRSLITARAPQPYRRLEDLRAPPEDGPIDGGDLLADLVADLSGFPTGPKLRVVTGNAGVGKTVLVNALCQALHERFNDAKRAGAGLASRPLLFSPEELGAKTPETVDALLAQVYNAELAAHVPPEAFRWLNEAGFAVWVFDGLDEFYRAQTDFFPMLATALGAPGSRAQFVVCTRDSLLASSPELGVFLREAKNVGVDAEVYELTRWTGGAKEAFIAQKLAALGYEGAAAESRKRELTALLRKEPALDHLTDLPFYADLFVTTLQQEDAPEAIDEFALLQSAVDALIERERGKISIDWDAFVTPEELAEVREYLDDAEGRGFLSPGENPVSEALAAYGKENLEHILGAAAHLCRRAGDGVRSIGAISLSEWRDVMTSAEFGRFEDAETASRAQLALMQFAFFARGRGGESVSFVHELIAEFLAAKYAFALIQDAPERPEDLGASARRAPAQGRRVLPLRAGAVVRRPVLAGANRRQAGPSFAARRRRPRHSRYDRRRPRGIVRSVTPPARAAHAVARSGKNAAEEKNVKGRIRRPALPLRNAARPRYAFSYDLPVAAATSAAKSLSSFSTPSPTSKRT